MPPGAGRTARLQFGRDSCNPHYCRMVLRLAGRQEGLHSIGDLHEVPAGHGGLSHVLGKPNMLLSAVTPGDIAGFRDSLRASGHSAKTCNLAKSVISAGFAAAVRQGLLSHNPCLAVDNLRERAVNRSGREAFSHEELLKIVAEARGDWLGLILCCSTSGLRISDASALTWGDIDLDKGLLAIRTQKTGAAVTLPLHGDFKGWLAAQPPAIGKAQLFPSLAGVGTGGSNGLSMQFRELMHRAGITERIIQADGDKGRTRSSKSFHSLRHYVVSQLANQGVAVDVRKSLVGHSDSKSHAIYTHHDDLVRRDAIAKLPSVLNHAVQA